MLGLAEHLRDLAFGSECTDGHRHHREPPFERTAQRVEHSSCNVRNARHQEEIADPDTGSPGHSVFDELGAFWNPRHAQAALVEAAPVGIIAFKRVSRGRVNDNWNAEGLGNGINRYVVMCRADPTSCETIVVGTAKGIYCLDDAVLDIWNHPHFGEADPLRVQPGGDLRDVPVLGSSREYLIADHHETGRPGSHFGHPKMTFLALG